MAKIPEPIQRLKVIDAIYQAYEADEKPRFSRRLGASVIGAECPRRLWYAFRWAKLEKFDGRMLRLFDTGKREEPRLIAELRRVGCEVADLIDGNQIEYTAVGGHVVTKIDAAAMGIPDAPKTPHVCEFKTASNKSWNDLAKKGLKKGKPEHYAQLVIGMALGEFARGLYLSVNKDNDEIYGERLRWEEVKDDAAKLLAEAERVIRSPRAPDRIGDDKEALPCKWCSYRDICHGGLPPDPAVPACLTCRSCVHSTPKIEAGNLGRWVCEKHKKTLGEQEQQTACADHVWIPDFIVFAEAVDGGDGEHGAWVEYKKPSGTTFRNCNSGHHYRSKELATLPEPMIGLGTIDAVKSHLPGEVVEVENG